MQRYSQPAQPQPPVENPPIDGVSWDADNPDQSSTYTVLPGDTYYMKCTNAWVERNIKFGQEAYDKTGEYPKQFVMDWAVSRVTAEQQEAGIQLGESVRKYFSNIYMGMTKDGKPSVFKAFTDSLIEQGLLPRKFTPKDFINIEQRIVVEVVQKANGYDGNRITAILPLRPQRRAAAPAQAGGPPSRPIPAPIVQEEELFEQEDEDTVAPF